MSHRKSRSTRSSRSPRARRTSTNTTEKRGVFRLDRVLYSPLHYPADYGFVPETLAEDDDPLDILVLISTPTFPGCLVPARVIGALTMEDDRGIDTKLLSVAAVDPRYDRVQELRHLSPHSIREMEYFFGIYKDLEGKKSVVTGWHDRGFAEESLRQGQGEVEGDRRAASQTHPASRGQT